MVIFSNYASVYQLALKIKFHITLTSYYILCTDILRSAFSSHVQEIIIYNFSLNMTSSILFCREGLAN